MAMFCRLCGFSNFRTSHFRFQKSDLARLLVLRLPVRCLNCDERSFASLGQFLSVRRACKAFHTEQSSTK
jgi:hypothetical protein